MCFTSVVFADVRGTENSCLCAFRDAFLKQGERKREKPLLPFLALLFSCVSNTLCAWFCLNPRMANNHTLWKLPTSSHSSSWFVVFFFFFLLLMFGNLQRQKNDAKLGGLTEEFILAMFVWSPVVPWNLPQFHCLLCFFKHNHSLGWCFICRGSVRRQGRWMGESPSSHVGWTASFMAITFWKCVLIFYSFCERHEYLSVNYKSVNLLNLLVLLNQGCLMFRWICIPLNGSCNTLCSSTLQ